MIIILKEQIFRVSYKNRLRIADYRLSSATATATATATSFSPQSTVGTILSRVYYFWSMVYGPWSIVHINYNLKK